MLVLIVIFIALGMALRAWRGEVWLVTMRNGYILPHWQASWTSLAIIFFGFLQGTLWCTVQYLNGQSPADLTLWKTLVWTPAWLAGFTAMWVLGVSHLLTVKSKGVTITSIFATPTCVNTSSSQFCT